MSELTFKYEMKDTYFVALKVLLRNQDNLLITHDIFGDWDIPGGRLKPDEFATPLENVIKRKMKEELGDRVIYGLGEPKVFFRHERIEQATNQAVRIFGVGYEAAYQSGEIVLGDHHDEYRWVNVANFDPKDYFTGGWLRGLQEYLSIEGKTV